MSKYLAEVRERDDVLTHLAVGYRQAGFVGEQIAPQVFTDKEGIKVPVYGKGSFVEYETERAVGAASNVITLDRGTTLPVVLDEHDLAAGVDYRVHHESRHDEKAKATRRVTTGIQLKQELETARLIQDKSVYQSGHVEDLSQKATSQWTHAESDVQELLENAKETVRKSCGIRPNILVVGPQVLSKLRMNEGLRSNLSANDRKLLLNIETLKTLLDVDDIIVGNSVYTVGNGKPTKDVWCNFASLIVRPTIVSDGNDEGQTAFAYTFRRRGMPVVDRYDEVGGKVEMVRYTDIRKPAVVGGACGYLFQNPIA
ncbi:TPA: hypothetical protein ACFP4Q_001329 [Neisseria weaveri]